SSPCGVGSTPDRVAPDPSPSDHRAYRSPLGPETETVIQRPVGLTIRQARSRAGREVSYPDTASSCAHRPSRAVHSGRGDWRSDRPTRLRGPASDGIVWVGVTGSIA